MADPNGPLKGAYTVSDAISFARDYVRGDLTEEKCVKENAQRQTFADIVAYGVSKLEWVSTQMMAAMVGSPSYDPLTDGETATHAVDAALALLTELQRRANDEAVAKRNAEEEGGG